MVRGGAGLLKVGESGLWAMIERKLPSLSIAPRPGWRGQCFCRLKWVQGTAGR